MKRGIYLVANLRSQAICKNLIYSVRSSGCTLPIRLIHFGGKEIHSRYILNQVELIRFEDFSLEAQQFITDLRSVLTDCPLGFLYRFLAWFSDWDEFIYSDNDIVALCNWSDMFNYLEGYDLVHADEEYTTKGIFNYNMPSLVDEIFGEFALESAITAGHIVVKRNSKMIEDIKNALEWFKNNPHIPKKHDQALMHIASLLGEWKLLNLCKSHNWLSSWAGDYKNSLQLIQLIQNKNTKISHLHYSGGTPQGNLAIQDFLFSKDGDHQRLIKLSLVSLTFLSGFNRLRQQYLRVKNYCSRRLKKGIVLNFLF
jgi:hypothetical protein